MAQSGRKPISYESVKNACEQLQAEKEKITLRNIILITGGSFSTISGHFKKWKEKCVINTEIDLPQDLVITLKAAYKKMIEAVEQVWREKLTQEVTHTKEALGEVVRLESDCLRLNEKINDIQQDFSDKRKVLEQQNAMFKSRMEDALQRESSIKNQFDELSKALRAAEIKPAVAETKLANKKS